jgi:hypothetical protein
VDQHDQRIWEADRQRRAAEGHPVFGGQYLGSVASYVTRADGRQHVVYVTEDRQLWELYWLGNQLAQGRDLLAQVSAPHPGASLSAYVGHDGSQHVIYLDQHRRVIELQWSGNAAGPP